MALGIDGAAHRGALQAGGGTVAVLAGGPDSPYPRSHRLLYEQILETGCVISENPPGVEARRWAFVARNRIIAGISSMTVWVEGAESSGAKHTFDFADALGLPVGAVPGPVSSPMSAGPNGRLGLEGVRTIRGIDDVVAELAIELGPPRLPGIEHGGTGLASLLLDHIAAGSRTPRELSAALGEYSPREISQALGNLELAGAVVREPSGEYRRLR
jgi:DNA processing protein